MRLKRWLYIVVVIVGAIGLAAGAQFVDSPFYLFVPSLFVAALTHPLGLLAEAVRLPLIYSGIAEPAEAMVVSAPLFALLGYVQWYVLLPRLFRGSSQVSV